MANNTVRVTVDDSKLVKMIQEIQAQGSPVRIVADGVNYGIFLEYGTVKMSARPMLRNAVESNQDALEKGLKQAGEDFGRTTLVVEKAAFDVLRDWQENARAMHAIDTGAFINSLHVIDGKDGEFNYEVPGK